MGKNPVAAMIAKSNEQLLQNRYAFACICLCFVIFGRQESLWRREGISFKLWRGQGISFKLEFSKIKNRSKRGH